MPGVNDEMILIFTIEKDVHIHVYIYVYMYVYMYVYIYMYIYICIYIYMFVPCCLGYKGDDILPSYVRITMNHYKALY